MRADGVVPAPRHPAEEDLQRWSHHHGVSTVNDEVLKQAGEGFVSFVFGLEVEGKDLSLFAKEDEEKRAAAAAAKAAGKQPQCPGRPGVPYVRVSGLSLPVAYGRCAVDMCVCVHASPWLPRAGAQAGLRASAGTYISHTAGSIG